MNILPPDTPDDIYPVPYAERLIHHALPIPKNVVKEMKAMGIRNLGDLDLFFIRGGDLTEIKGVGPATQAKIVDAYDSLQVTKELLNV